MAFFSSAFRILERIEGGDLEIADSSVVRVAFLSSARARAWAPVSMIWFQLRFNSVRVALLQRLSEGLGARVRDLVELGVQSGEGGIRLQRPGKALGTDVSDPDVEEVQDGQRVVLLQRVRKEEEGTRVPTRSWPEGDFGGIWSPSERGA
jgi:hypothetical protein